MTDRPWQDKEKLRKEYFSVGNTYDLSEKWECDNSTIAKWLRKHDIPRFQMDPNSPVYDAEKLKKIYNEEESIQGVVDRLPNTSTTITVIKWMNEFGIETNNKKPNKRSRKERKCDECGKVSEIPVNEAEKNNWFCNRDCYIKSRKGITGPDHPAWNGGPPEDNPYGGNWSRIAERIKIEDGKCKSCGSEENLEVHHIEKVRTFDDYSEAHKRGNLVTLCSSCHIKIEDIPVKTQKEMFSKI